MGKPFTFNLGRLFRSGCEAHPGPIGAAGKAVWGIWSSVGVVVGGVEAALDLIGLVFVGVEVVSRSAGVIAGAIKAASGPVGMFAGVVGAALGAAALYWLGGVKQNSSEAKPLSCEHLVGVTRFELVTSSVSGKRSHPELNARSRVRECAGNNITELPPSGKNIF